MHHPDINVGDVVVAIKPGGHDREGLPVQRPIVGRHYRITSIYGMRYGLGCTLQNMDPFPYRGYFLYVKRPTRLIDGGWYFRKVEVADTEFTETLYELLRSKSHAKAD